MNSSSPIRLSLPAILLLALFVCPLAAQQPVEAKTERVQRTSQAAAALFQWPGFLSLAHSHNDYEQQRPLIAAVEARLTSIEADLYLEGSVIMVGHDRGKWRGEFEALYLKPLSQLWENGSLAGRPGAPFLLWLDLKDPDPALRRNLRQLLAAYPVTRAADAARTPVEIILTGEKTAKEAFVNEDHSALITRDSNLYSDDDPPASPGWKWYALDWTKLGTWNGEGPMPAIERERLAALVGKIHANGRKLRLWKHPATLAFWQEASAAGVDRLGTDLLPENAGK